MSDTGHGFGASEVIIVIGEVCVVYTFTGIKRSESALVAILFLVIFAPSLEIVLRRIAYRGTKITKFEHSSII